MNLKRRDFLKGAAATGASLGLASKLTAQTGSGALLTKPIPSSGEQLPIIGIGTNQYGGDTWDNGTEETYEGLRETLKIYTDAGGTLIDTAPAYRGAEAVLGQLFAELGISNNLFISNKVGSSSAARATAEMTNSENLLGVDQQDLVEVHSARNWRQQLPALYAAKEEGRIRYLGVTVWTDGDHQELAEIMSAEQLDFVQFNYNILGRNAEQKLLSMAQDLGVAVLVNVPFARGETFAAVSGKELPDFAKEFDCQSWGNFFLKYIVSHPSVTAAIPGTSKPHHAADNLYAAMGRLPSAAERKMQEDFIAGL